MLLHKHLDALLVVVTNKDMAIITTVLTVSMATCLAVIFRGFVLFLVDRGLCNIADTKREGIRKLVPYSWLVNSLSGIKDVLFGGRLLMQGRENISTGFLFILAGTILVVAKLAVPSAIISWSTFDIGLCPINTTSTALIPARLLTNSTANSINSSLRNRNIKAFMNTELVVGHPWEDDVKVSVRDGCQDWIKAPCTNIPELNKTVRVQFSDQAHQMVASPLGTLTLLHDANCSFIHAPSIMQTYDIRNGDGNLQTMFNITFGYFRNTPFNTTFVVTQGDILRNDIMVQTGEIAAGSTDRLVEADWVDVISDPSYRAQFSKFFYVWVPGFSSTIIPHSDVLYNYTVLRDYGYTNPFIFRTIACTTAIGIKENTQEYGEMIFNAPTVDELSSVYFDSLVKRKLPLPQLAHLLGLFTEQHLVAIHMRNTASAVLGNALERANQNVINVHIVPSSDMALADHFKFMAAQHQRVVRAQLMGDLYGTINDGVLMESKVDSLVERGIDRETALKSLESSLQGRVICAGSTLSVIRILVIYCPVLLLTLIFLAYESLLPVSLLYRFRDKKIVGWILRRRANQEAVKIEDITKFAEESVGGSSSSPLVGRIYEERTKNALRVRLERFDAGYPTHPDEVQIVAANDWK